MNRQTQSLTPSDGVEHLHAGAVLFAASLAVVIVVAGVSSINVAIPLIGRELRAGQSELQWVADSYAMVVAALLLPFGALGDRLGRKRVMSAGLVVLAGSQVWAVAAGSATALIGARGLAGAGAAMIFPATLATITSAFPVEKRGRAVGVWVASASTGGILGILAAGALVEELWYGSIFVATGVGALVCLAVTLALVPDTSDPEHAHLDPPGALLSVVAVGGLVFGVTEGPVRGWTSTPTLVALLLGVLGCAGFVLQELRTARPLLDVRLFRHRAFTAGAVSVFLQFFAGFGFLFVAAQYLALIRGYDPLQTGLAFLPLGVLVVPLSSQGTRLADRFGRGAVGGVGLGAFAVGFATLATLEPGSSYVRFLVGILIFGAGMALSAPPATEAIVEALPVAKQGVASAINDVARELGGALGIAALGSAFNASYRGAIADVGGGIPTEVVEAVRRSPGAGLAIAAELGAPGEAVAGLVRAAFMDGFATTMWLGALALAVGAVFVAVWMPRHAPQTEGVRDREPSY